ncbi:MAG: DUF5680 domain-containing protein [Candidatus Buchananbacteria bacterium]
MINQQQLCEFLVKAKKVTYAAGAGAQTINESDKSKTLNFTEGDWHYQDNYFGGEPFGGREVVFFKNQPVYLMVYYGRVEEVVTDFEPVYQILRQALSLIPDAQPFRGPAQYQTGDYVYINNYQGEVDNFFGEEKISYQGAVVYQARYAGGLVDQKK